MKQTIRVNTFETNSSSMHTICIANHCEDYKELDEYELDICLNEEYVDFQGCGNPLTTPKAKLAYLFAYALGCSRNPYVYSDAANRGLINAYEDEPITESDASFQRAQEVCKHFHRLFPRCRFAIKYSECGDQLISINHQSMESEIMDAILEDPDLIKWYMSSAGTVYLISDGESMLDVVSDRYSFSDLHMIGSGSPVGNAYYFESEEEPDYEANVLLENAIGVDIDEW